MLETPRADLQQVWLVRTSMYSTDRVLNESILGVDEVHAEAGETNPLRKRDFRETKTGSTDNLNTPRTSRGRALMNFSSAVLNTWIFAKGVSIANCRRKECLAGHVEHCRGRAEKHIVTHLQIKGKTGLGRACRIDDSQSAQCAI
jgi:hypothetical protein